MLFFLRIKTNLNFSKTKILTQDQESNGVLSKILSHPLGKETSGPYSFCTDEASQFFKEQIT